MSDTDPIREAHDAADRVIHSLTLVGDSDWTPQDMEAYRLAALTLAALARVEADMAAKDALLDRVIEAGVEMWHTVVNDEPSLSSWLGLTDAEYSAWVECRDLAAVSDGETGT